MLQIIEVFVPTRGGLVGLEVGERDQVDLSVVQNIDHTFSVARREIHPRNGSRNLNANGWNAESHNLAFFEE
jgi:hypothetical protein